LTRGQNNILIDDQKRPRICDFGLSQMINEEAGSGFTTTTPHTGNARYAAYEIIFQEDGPFSPSTASDVFSLGCVIYEVSASIHRARYGAETGLVSHWLFTILQVHQSHADSGGRGKGC
jgi:serine/threonine protein kinase